MTDLVAPQVKDRKGIIGASDAGTVCGVNPWGSIVDLWKVCTGREEGFAGNAKTDWGNRLEPVIREAYSEETGRAVELCPDTFRHPEYKFIVAHPDGKCEDRLLEIKAPGRDDDWGESGSDKVPMYYLTQVQHQMMLTGTKLCDVAALFHGNDFRIYTVPFNERVANRILELEVKFFREHVEKDVPPEPMTTADAVQLWGKNTDEERNADKIAVQAVRMLHDAQMRIKAAKADEDAAKLELQKFMRSAAVLTFDGKKLASWKTQSRTVFDTKAFKEAQSNLYRQFSKTTESRVFRLLKGGKELSNG